MSLPKPSTAKDVFSHLLMIVALYVGVISFLTLMFQLINVLIPDQLDFYYYNGAIGTMRGAIAAIIVVWPVYLLISWLISKDMKIDVKYQKSKIKKWLLYLTLFVASITIIVDLISLMHEFLNGEITTRFILKALTVLIVTAAVFWYYLWELKRDYSIKTNIPKIAAFASSAVILIALVAGFVQVGSPTKQRAIRFDEERIADLSYLQNEIVIYYQQTEHLPESLNELTGTIGGTVIPTDPESQTEYEYKLLSETDFELCATFTTDQTNEGNLSPKAIRLSPYEYIPEITSGQSWVHGVGKACFKRIVDPERLKYPER